MSSSAFSRATERAVALATHDVAAFSRSQDAAPPPREQLALLARLCEPGGIPDLDDELQAMTDLLCQFAAKKAAAATASAAPTAARHVSPAVLRAAGNDALRAGDNGSAARLYTAGLFTAYAAPGERALLLHNRAVATGSVDDATAALLSDPAHAKAWHRRGMRTGDPRDDSVGAALAQAVRDGARRADAVAGATAAARRVFDELVAPAALPTETPSPAGGAWPVVPDGAAGGDHPARAVGAGAWLRAARALEPGDVAVEDAPAVLVSLSPAAAAPELRRPEPPAAAGGQPALPLLPDARCGRCLAPLSGEGSSAAAAGILPCAGWAHCLTVYCGVRCLATDWADTHRHECEGRPQTIVDDGSGSGSGGGGGARSPTAFLHFRVLPREALGALRLARAAPGSPAAAAAHGLVWHVRGVPPQQLAELLVTAGLAARLLERCPCAPAGRRGATETEVGCSVSPSVCTQPATEGVGGFDATTPRDLRVATLLRGLLQLRANAVAVRLSGGGGGGGGGRDPHALALYPRACMANHSCQPNGFLAFPPGAGGRAALVALAPIPERAAVTLSYLPTALRMPVGSQRRAYLRERYSFECACPACAEGGAAEQQRVERHRRHAALWVAADRADAAGDHAAAAGARAAALWALRGRDPTPGDAPAAPPTHELLSMPPAQLVQGWGPTVAEELGALACSLEGAGPSHADAARAAAAAAAAVGALLRL